ncbi:hypothetical protein Tsubulata_016199 [Turnera subulata]|uniref:Uncharacterized protein n=1 Tax=Turnera subulata TaxID=218843 RepID=A0A9Q0JNP9_9ROSI|nr:hypothetical protein Tsubulata_016199 [Turnera subulata]
MTVCVVGEELGSYKSVAVEHRIIIPICECRAVALSGSERVLLQDFRQGCDQNPASWVLFWRVSTVLVERARPVRKKRIGRVLMGRAFPVYGGTHFVDVSKK